MRDNRDMREEIRLVFSGIWFIATGCVFSSGLVFLITLGKYGEYFLGSLIVWVVAHTIVWVSTFD